MKLEWCCLHYAVAMRLSGIQELSAVVRLCLNACSWARIALLEGGHSFRGRTLLGETESLGARSCASTAQASFLSSFCFMTGMQSDQPPHSTATVPSLLQWTISPGRQRQINLPALKLLLDSYLITAVREITNTATPPS